MKTLLLPRLMSLTFTGFVPFSRNQLKARYLMNTECQDALIEDIASQVR